MANKKGPIKIEPFRHPVSMDPQYAEKTWKVIEEAINEIHNQNASGLSFEELYRNAYNMVLHKFGERLYTGTKKVITDHLKSIAVKVEGSGQGPAFLRELKKRWDDHIKSTQMVRDILMYMDRTFVTTQNKTPVYALGLELWRDHVVRHPTIRSRTLSVLLDLIQRERLGEVIDRSIIRSTTQMLVDLGHAVYVDDFESPFLASSTEFYRKEAIDLMLTSDCPEYLSRAERRLKEEQERVKIYLDPITDPKVTKVVEQEMITHQMRALVDMENSGLVPLMRDDRYNDLLRMFALLKRVDGGAALVRQVACDHVRESGRQWVTDPEKCKEPVEYVQRLMDERDKVDRVLVRSFGDDKTFRNALNQAFEGFINLNQRSPEYISLYIDELLRKGQKGGAEAESDAAFDALVDKAMVLFRYLQEKDVFEKYYKQHLSKRLLSGRPVSDDAERSLLMRLKTECGYQFTSKLESMFADIRTGRDMMVEFKSRLADKGTVLGVDLQVQVLTTGSWPSQSTSKCNLPRELEECCEAFRSFYLDSHSGRKLAWQTNMGTADLRVEFGGGRRHELNVSTYQMCVLMLYNDGVEKLTCREIAEATDIPPADLQRCLQSLALIKGRNVLRKEPAGKDILDSDVFYFNEAFQSKLFKVKIGTVAAQKEQESEKQETRQKAEEDRKPEIDAAIMRIMKSRKVLDHNSIITEVTRQLASRFRAEPSVIKKRIESLIEREFIERDAEDRKLYRYVA